MFARVTLSGRGRQADGANGERKDPIRCRATKDQLRRENGDNCEGQPPVESAAMHQPSQEARAVIFLLLEDMQIGQKPPRGEYNKRDQRDQPGRESNHDRRSRKSLNRWVNWCCPSVNTFQ